MSQHRSTERLTNSRRFPSLSRSSSALLLLGLLSTLTGCLDIGMHYLIRQDGSLHVRYDMVMEKSILQMFYVMADPGAQVPHATDSSIAVDTSGIPTTFRITKAVADSVRAKLFGKQLSRLKAMPEVLSAVSSDSLAYDGLHFLLDVDLRSYRDVKVLHHVDSAKTKSKFAMADSIVVRERGDSVMFMIADLSSLASQTSIPDFPGFHQNDGWLKKTLHHPRAITAERPLFNYASWQRPVVDTPSTQLDDADSIQVDPDDEDSTGDDSSDQSGLDSVMQNMKMFTTLFSGLINIDMSIQSPLLLSHDSSAMYDPVTHTASWHLDIASILALKEHVTDSGDAPKYYVWFRRPKGSR